VQLNSMRMRVITGNISTMYQQGCLTSVVSAVVAVNDTPTSSRLVDGTSGLSVVVVEAGVVIEERVVVVAQET